MRRTLWRAGSLLGLLGLLVMGCAEVEPQERELSESVSTAEATADPCAPDVFVAACKQDTDGDGASDYEEGELIDSDGDGVLDYAESSLDDSDGDGLSDEVDPANADACAPEVFISACTQDTDGDGASDYEEGELTDSDGDGVLDYAESSRVDTDGDGLNDQADPDNGTADACTPEVFVAA